MAVYSNKFHPFYLIDRRFERYQRYLEKDYLEHQIYKDKVSRWSGLGNQEFRKNIEIAYLKNLKVRPIITLSKNFEEILKGADGSQFKNTFNAKLNWVGIVKLWDGENFIIEFVEEKT